MRGTRRPGSARPARERIADMKSNTPGRDRVDMSPEEAADIAVEERDAELSDEQVEGVSGGADGGVVRPCPFCGHELKWTAMAMEFMCFNRACPDYFYRDRH